MFLAFLGLLFGGGAFWGFGTENGRDFLTGLFPALRGIFAFLNPDRDPDGSQREELLRSEGLMGRLARGAIRQFAPAEAAPLVAAVTETPAVFNEFLDALKEGGVPLGDLARRNVSQEAILAAITPATLTGVLRRPDLAGRVLGAAQQMMSGTGAPSENAQLIQRRVTQAATQLLTDPAQEANLRRIFNENPRIMEQLLPLVTAPGRSGAAPGGMPTLAAILGNPVIIEQLRNPEQQARLSSMLTQHGAALGITPETLAFLQARSADGSRTNLQVVMSALSDPALRGTNGQMRPEVSALLTTLTSGTPSAATLTQPLMALVQMPGSERVISQLRNLALPESMAAARPALALLTDANVGHLRTALSGMNEPSRARLGELVTSLTGSGPTSGIMSNLGAMTTLIAENKPAMLQLLSNLDVSALPEAQRAQLASARQLATLLDGQPSREAGSTNLDIALRMAADPYLQTPQAQALLTSVTSGTTAPADLVHQAMTLIQDPQAEGLLTRVGQLQLSDAAVFGSAGAVTGLLTPNNIRLMRETLTALGPEQRTQLTGLIEGLTAAEPNLNIGSALSLMRNPQVRRLVEQLEIDRLPPEMSATFTRVRGMTSIRLPSWLGGGAATAQPTPTDAPTPAPANAAPTPVPAPKVPDMLGAWPGDPLTAPAEKQAAPRVSFNGNITGGEDVTSRSIVAQATPPVTASPELRPNHSSALT